MRVLVYYITFYIEHFPPSVPCRFLIEGNKGAVLHTGDFQAEACFLESISRNPYLQSYLARPQMKLGSIAQEFRTVRKTLDTIYLDMASLLSKLDAPAKVWSNPMHYCFILVKRHLLISTPIDILFARNRQRQV